MKRDNRRQEHYFNQKAKPLQPLHPGDEIQIKPHINGQKKWKKATVWRRLDEQLYHVKVDGELYQQNRVDLKKNIEAPPLASLTYQSYEMHCEVPVNAELGTEETCNPETPQYKSEMRERVSPTPSSTIPSPERVRTTQSEIVIRDPSRFKNFTA